MTLNEPACGAGAMVIAFADAMLDAKLNPQTQLHATCQDVDPRGVHMCYLQLSLMHIPATVILGNSLSVECREVWHTPAHILGGWDWRLRARDFADAIKGVLSIDPANDSEADAATVELPPVSKALPPIAGEQAVLF